LAEFTSNEVYFTFDRIIMETEFYSWVPGSIQASVSLNFEYDDSPVVDATIMISDTVAENMGNGVFSATLASWMPKLTINIKTERLGFEPVITEEVIYPLGNIISESAAIILLTFFAVLRLNSRNRQRRRWDMNLSRIEKLVRKRGRIKIDEASKITGLDTDEINALLSELKNTERIDGTFTSDGNSFITEEKLREEVIGGSA
jgi:hypothetical protein